MKKDTKCDHKMKGEKMMKPKAKEKEGHEKKEGMKMLKEQEGKKEKGEMKNADMGKEYSKYKKMKK